MNKYLTIFFLFIVCCKSKNNDQIVFSHVENTPIKGEILNFINTGCYYQTEVFNDILILLNACGENYFEIYDLNNGKLLLAFGKKGDGPQEFHFPIILKESGESEIIIHDVNHKKIKYFNLEDIMNENFIPKQVLSVKTNALGGFQLSFIDSNTLIGKDHIEGKGLFFIHDISSNKNNWVDYYPKIPKNTPKDKIPLMYDNHIINLKEKQKIAVALQYFNRLNFYNYEGKLLNTVVVGKDYTPNFSIKSDFLIPQQAMVFFIDLKYANSNIFALFVDKTQQEYANTLPEVIAGVRLLKFDINGKIIQTYTINEDLISFCLNNKGDKMYGIFYDQNGAGIIYEYKL